VTHCVAGAFLLLVVGGVAPPSARASCGRDVTSSLSRSTGKWLSRLELLGEPFAKPVDPASGDPRPQGPCSGPSCSGGRDLPHAPAPSPEPTDPSDSWCCTIVAQHWGGSLEPTGTLANLPSVHPRHSTSPLERPPRGALAHSSSPRRGWSGL